MRIKIQNQTQVSLHGLVHTCITVVDAFGILSSNPIHILQFSGVAQFCPPATQTGGNTVKFCQIDSTSGQTVYLVSGAQTYATVHSCKCEIDIKGTVGNISLSYIPGNAMDNCGVRIDIDDRDNVFTCEPIDLNIQALKNIEFSRSDTTETHFCLQISLGGYNVQLFALYT